MLDRLLDSRIVMAVGYINAISIRKNKGKWWLQMKLIPGICKGIKAAQTVTM